MNSLSILFWNCNGINHIFNELNTFSKLNNIHTILLQETRIIPSTPLKLPNFFTYRQDRTPKPRTPPSGGTAILIRKNIVHNEDTTKTIIDSTSISIKLGNDNVRISSVYKSPNAPLTVLDLEPLTSESSQFIATGDLNSKHPSWNSRSTNSSGRLLHNYMEKSNSFTICAPDSPTHHSYNPHHSSEVLDIALINLKDRDYTITNHNELSSDYNPIMLSIYDSTITSSPPKSKKRVNWKRFEEQLLWSLPKIKNHIINTTDIDNEVSSLTSSVQWSLENNSYTIR